VVVSQVSLRQTHSQSVSQSVSRKQQPAVSATPTTALVLDRAAAAPHACIRPTARVIDL